MKKVFTFLVVWLLCNGAHATEYDKWGIQKLYPTKSGGVEWFAKWDEGVEREYYCDTRATDTVVDPYLHFNGEEAHFHIYGANRGKLTGTMKWWGISPRMYVRFSDADSPGSGVHKWGSVEVTVYIATSGYHQYYYNSNQHIYTEQDDWSWAGIEACAATDHWPEVSNPAYDCGTAGYCGRMLFNGMWDFEKEISHESESYKNTCENSEACATVWPSGMPLVQYIGYKFILRYVDNGQCIHMEMHKDYTSAGDTPQNQWSTRYLGFEDSLGADWSGGYSSYCHDELNGRASGDLLDPNYSVYLRTDALDYDGYGSIGDTEQALNSQTLKWFSIREIDDYPGDWCP